MAQMKKSLLDYFDIESAAATEVRRIYSFILAKSSEKNSQSVLISSSMVGEGKTTCASLIAIIAAVQSNRQTLLIDGDLRKPSIHKLFELSLSSGIGEVAAGKIELDDALRKTDIDNLTVLTAGQISENPIELINKGIFTDILQKLKSRFGFIFVDCPPIIPVSDPLLLAPHVDGTVLVIRAGATSRKVVERAYRLLEQASVEIIGIVLNNLNGVLPDYYNQKYYGYQYVTEKKPPRP